MIASPATIYSDPTEYANLMADSRNIRRLLIAIRRSDAIDNGWLYRLTYVSNTTGDETLSLRTTTKLQPITRMYTVPSSTADRYYIVPIDHWLFLPGSPSRLLSVELVDSKTMTSHHIYRNGTVDILRPYPKASITMKTAIHVTVPTQDPSAEEEDDRLQQYLSRDDVSRAINRLVTGDQLVLSAGIGSSPTDEDDDEMNNLQPIVVQRHGRNTCTDDDPVLVISDATAADDCSSSSSIGLYWHSRQHWALLNEGSSLHRRGGIICPPQPIFDQISILEELALIRMQLLTTYISILDESKMREPIDYVAYASVLRRFSATPLAANQSLIRQYMPHDVSECNKKTITCINRICIDLVKRCIEPLARMLTECRRDRQIGDYTCSSFIGYYRPNNSDLFEPSYYEPIRCRTIDEDLIPPVSKDICWTRIILVYASSGGGNEFIPLLRAVNRLNHNNRRVVATLNEGDDDDQNDYPLDYELEILRSASSYRDLCAMTSYRLYMDSDRVCYLYHPSICPEASLVARIQPSSSYQEALDDLIRQYNTLSTQYISGTATTVATTLE